MQVQEEVLPEVVLTSCQDATVVKLLQESFVEFQHEPVQKYEEMHGELPVLKKKKAFSLLNAMQLNDYLPSLT